MEKNLEKLWEDTLKVVKEEITQVSFETWIKRIEPISYTNNVIVLGVENDFTKGILEARYSVLIANSLKHVTKESNIVVEFVIPTTSAGMSQENQANTSVQQDRKSQSSNGNGTT